MNKYIFLSVVTMVLISCGKSKPTRSTVDASEMKEIVLSNDSIMYIEDWVRDVEVIPLETSDKALVSTVDGVIVTDSNIIVYDTRQAHRVSIFDRNGKHWANINRRGRGPQEYMRLDHVTMLPDNQALAIYDNGGTKVLYFSLDGHFISSVPTGFWFSTMEYLDEKNVLCATYGAGGQDPGLEEYENRTNLLYFTDRKFGIKGSTMPTRYKNRIPIVPYIRKFEDKVYINRPFSDTIYQAIPGGLKAVYRIDMEKINGIANLDPGITHKDYRLLLEKKASLTGRFTASDGYMSLSFRIPPEGEGKNYFYSKQTGKAYAVERDYRKTEDILLWHLHDSPITSVKDRFVSVIPAHHCFTTGIFDPKTGIRTTAATQRPELAGLTEDSNPVVILYSFKEGL